MGRIDMSEPDLDKIQGIGLLKELSESELITLSRDCSWKRYAANEQIIDRQSETNDVFFIIEGKVRVVNYSLSGRVITLDDIVAGGHFGELAAIDEKPRSASVMALMPCFLAVISQGCLIDLVKNHSSVALTVMRDLSAVIRKATERIMDLSTLAANNRVQADLLQLASANITENGHAIISPIPVHSDVASRVSTTRETVARVMGNLARQGVVERQRDKLVINDVAQLREMVEVVRGE